MKFTKMEGCGNDYIYVDTAREQLPASREEKEALIVRLSDRHFGIGGDGVILINPCAEGDFEMEMYNADGSRGKMCGNGIRCVGKFVYDKGLTDKEEINVVSAGVPHILKLICKDAPGYPNGKAVEKVRVDMGAPILEPEQIPVIPRDRDAHRAVDMPVLVEGKEYRMTCVSMGNPHSVIFLGEEDPALEDLDLERMGPSFEHHVIFPERVNTEFVRVIDRKHVQMRVWERGSGETLACGTGACAVAVACVLNGLTEEEVTVSLRGGDLAIRWDRAADTVFMTGPATTVFEGEVQI
ncbi:MAG: diaminopimelate epimerase [Lachnospiraceae bacterium]|nr:diaminopimelate epimerase [Lachnospiraceae bacterium]